ncbi:Si-specific NAD(P)(+) transhydrogenase [Roseibium alexandrii]|jgi:NAD(P) transhydrogenase|uniref:Soluble pyridine nucleotide transhydrogenase n=1 Tax=Roseibium alexandrii (strain DSM 17067 / NCIMB 14079 / DFL-11) TaxID=244592 RepID=A0A5E8GZB3_ROSAD|nr:Si-specific NAD(P)(+) transhydrogenase [Roseibium alexandrii]EEE44939.1 Pyruvate/2-oxoglutarate dehydrogenase complex [Roseibium alexandrii DFL-11]
MEHFDLIVIGSGPAGRRAAIQAAKFGYEVLVVERGRRVGGVSVHTGTIPSKTLRETVLNLTGWRERGFYGRSYRVKQDISAGDLRARLHMTLDHEVEVLELQFARNKVSTVYGEARFVSPEKIEVKSEEGDVKLFSADKFILAVGTKPFRPDYVPFDGEFVLDSDEILELNQLPRSIAVIGAGVIGVEYASIFSALDVAVTLVEPRDTMLDFLDHELVSDFTHQLRDRGIAMRFGSKVKSIEKHGPGECEIFLEGGRSVRSNVILFAAGRMGATPSLNLEACGLEVDHRGRLKVDPVTFQTSVPYIYAAGDVIGFPSLASTSMEQGRIAACQALGEKAYDPPEYFPYGIYAVPEISTVGMTEEEIRERGIPYECGIARFRETSRGQIMGLDTGMLKMIFSLKTRRLLGCHIVGEGATELVHIGQAVLNLKGTLEYFVENTFNYPTLAEAYKIAALDAWNRMGPLKN